jgi:uncharacterized phage-associated protein
VGGGAVPAGVGAGPRFEVALGLRRPPRYTTRMVKQGSPDAVRSGLPLKVEAVLARLCGELGPLFKTHAVKLPYLVDVLAKRFLGHAITEGRHEAWELGVVTREVYQAITLDRLGPDFLLEEHRFSESGRRVRLRQEASPTDLSADELAIVDYVARCYGRLPAEQLGTLTKLLNTDLPAEAWGTNALARVDCEAAARLDEAWQKLGRRLPALDLEDRNLWSEPIQGDPLPHLRRSLL